MGIIWHKRHETRQVGRAAYIQRDAYFRYFCQNTTPPVKLLRTTRTHGRCLVRILRDTGSFSLGWLDCAQHQAPPSLEGLDDDLRRSLDSSFIHDIYPAELFTLPSWMTSEYLDLDFDRPVVDDGTPSPMLLVSASRSDRLLPCQPQHDDDVVPSTQRSPLFHSSSCSGGKLGWRLRPGCAGGSSSPSPPPPPSLKVLLSYLRFLVPLYRKVRALRAKHGGVVTTEASTMSGGSTSSRMSGGSTSSRIQWGHGDADAAIHKAIAYCKKSSVQEMCSAMNIDGDHSHDCLHDQFGRV